MRKTVTKVSMFIMMGVMLVLTGCSTAPEEKGIITLSVNPKIQIQYDEDGKVTKLIGQNEDGKKIVKGSDDYIGKECEDVIDDLIEDIHEAGYFKQEDGTRKKVILQLGGDSLLPEKDFFDKVSKSAEEKIKDLGISSYVHTIDEKNKTDYGEGSDGATDYNDTDYGPNNDGATDYAPSDDGADDKDTDYGPNNDGVTDYNNTDYGPNNDGATDYAPSDDGAVDDKDTDYGPNNDGVTDYTPSDDGADDKDTDYGPNNDGVTDYNDTDYGPNNDGVTDYTPSDDSSTDYDNDDQADDGTSDYTDNNSDYDD